jgi:hypothetical protein
MSGFLFFKTQFFLTYLGTGHAYNISTRTQEYAIFLPASHLEQGYKGSQRRVKAMSPWQDEEERRIQSHEIATTILSRAIDLTITQAEENPTPDALADAFHIHFSHGLMEFGLANPLELLREMEDGKDIDGRLLHTIWICQKADLELERRLLPKVQERLKKQFSLITINKAIEIEWPLFKKHSVKEPWVRKNPLAHLLRKVRVRCDKLTKR